MRKRLRVACDCNGVRASGLYEVDGDWLILKSTVGDQRVRLGISDPRKLAARLMKNVCMKATANAPAVSKPYPSPTISDKANQLADVQRNRVVAMAETDPDRPTEERLLDQIVANARAIDAAHHLLDQSSGSPDTTNA